MSKELMKFKIWKSKSFLNMGSGKPPRYLKRTLHDVITVCCGDKIEYDDEAMVGLVVHKDGTTTKFAYEIEYEEI